MELLALPIVFTAGPLPLYLAKKWKSRRGTRYSSLIGIASSFAMAALIVIAMEITKPAGYTDAIGRAAGFSVLSLLAAPIAAFVGLGRASKGS